MTTIFSCHFKLLYIATKMRSVCNCDGNVKDTWYSRYSVICVIFFPQWWQWIDHPATLLIIHAQWLLVTQITFCFAAAISAQLQWLVYVRWTHGPLDRVMNHTSLLQLQINSNRNVIGGSNIRNHGSSKTMYCECVGVNHVWNGIKWSISNVVELKVLVL